jgi:hypothetical protein
MVRFLFRHLKGYRFLVVVAIALTFAQVGASLLVAFPLKFILDKLVNHRDPHFPFAGIVLGVFDQLAPAPGGHYSAMAIIIFAATLLVALGLVSAGSSYVQLYFAAFIGQNLSARLQGRTVLTISHRLSTLGHVDEIIVLHKGRIAERGTFEGLKAAGGVFAWLLAEQNRYNLDRREGQGRRLLRHVPQALRPAPRPPYVAPPRAPSANGRRPQPSHVAPVGVPVGVRGLDVDGGLDEDESPTTPWSIRIPEGPGATVQRGRTEPDYVISRRHDGCARWSTTRPASPTCLLHAVRGVGNVLREQGRVS